MAIRANLLLTHEFLDARQSYTKRDAILYALGAGLGANPTDPADLPFLLEDRLKVLPTFAVTLGSPGLWIRAPEFGVDFPKLVHYQQATTFHAPIPPEAEVISRARVASVSDRGPGRGAVVVVERRISDAAKGTPYCTLRHSPSIIPDRDPDAVATFAVDPRAALIYRLSGDWNPLHADPKAAKRAGFARPILHGLASYAVAGVAVARALGASPAELSALACRFTGIVFPGDALSFRIWRDASAVTFQAFVGDRKALDQGFASFGGVV